MRSYDLDSLREGAVAADGVIHLAFIHDFSDYAGGVATVLVPGPGQELVPIAEKDKNIVRLPF